MNIGSELADRYFSSLRKYPSCPVARNFWLGLHFGPPFDGLLAGSDNSGLESSKMTCDH